MKRPIDMFIGRLEGVRQRSKGGWTARCPAHDDRHPSLIIDVGDDGRVLLFCYSGCPAADIAAAVGMTISDLFEKRMVDEPRHRRRKPYVSGITVVDIIDRERLVLLDCASTLRRGEALGADDLARLDLARERLQRLREFVA